MRLRPRLAVAAMVFVLLAGSVTSAHRPVLRRPEGEMLRNAQIVSKLLAARAHRLGVSAGPDPDTVYVGKSYTNHVAPDNYWNIYTGTYRPAPTSAQRGLGLGQLGGIQAPDSLQGWWPIREQYNADRRPHAHRRPAAVVGARSRQQRQLRDRAAGSAKRTFGVVGYWHADPGNGAGSAMMWSPISGTKSAWCGLRQHGDQSVKDQVTGQAFNQDVVQFLHRGGIGRRRFAQPLPRLRRPGGPDAVSRHRDAAEPVADGVVQLPHAHVDVDRHHGLDAHGLVPRRSARVTSGNFISSSAGGVNAPQDSFMVYVGAPVNDAACVYSDGVTRPVYDKQRRWFSEVLKTFGAGANYFEIFQKAGDNPTDTLSATPSSGPIVVPAATISSVLGGVAGNVRLVFRCKTNRGFADSDSRSFGLQLGRSGAVLLDDVTIDKGAGARVIGDFETRSRAGSTRSTTGSRCRRADRDGRLALDRQAVSAYIHAEALPNLTYNDLCGPPTHPRASATSAAWC
jgi:hypothetical protein